MPNRRTVSPANPRTTPPSAAGSRTNRKLSDGPDRNPLIDDLFDDLDAHSANAGVSRLQGESVSNRGSFADFKGSTRRPSTGNSISMRSGSNVQSRMAIDVVCRTAQHFVHAMRMNELEDFFSPGQGLSPEEALHRQLSKRTQQEMEAVVQVLVELLEEVRKARAQVAPLMGSIGLMDGRERAMSTSLFSTMSTASLMRPPVHETNQLAMAYDQQGNRMINCYTIIASLGQGAYGKVKLGVDASTGSNVAIKIIDKKHLKKKIGGLGSNDQDTALKREIAIMKKVRHRNCVSLHEVIDDPASNKLYLIMDYVPNGPVVRLKPQHFSSAALLAIEAGAPLNGEAYSRYLTRCAVRQRADGGETPLTASEIASQATVYTCKPVSQHICALYLRQLVSGLRYMHKRNLVHHDIKPDNILLGSDHQVYLTDFGVSEILSTRSTEYKEALSLDGYGNNEGLFNGSTTRNAYADQNDALAGSLAGDGAVNGGGGGGPKLGGGTLLFTSPELFDPDVNQNDVDPYLTDVWALGVTLYCILIGVTPYTGKTLPEVRRCILTQDFPWNGTNIYEAPLAPEWHTILSGLLAKDPKQRWTLQQLKSFLDNDGFQAKMQEVALQDAVVRAAARATTEAAPSNASKTSRVRPQVTVSGSGGKAVTGSLTSQSHRALSTSAALSLLSMDSANGVGNFFFGFDVSQAEVSQATRAAKVEVTERRLVVSPHARLIVQRFVERVRQRLRNRNCIQMSSLFSPFEAHFPSAGTSSPPVPSNPSKTASGSNIPALLSEVPVLSVAGSFHRTSASPTSNLVVPLRSPVHGDPRHVRRQSRAARQSAITGESNIAYRMRNCGSQSIDAILSIVNLQSTSNAFSRSFSFATSSDSSSAATGEAAPTVTETVAATAALTPAEAPLSDVVSIDASSTSARHAPANAMGETVMWCGTGRPPSTVAHAATETTTSSPDERWERRAAANGPGAKSRKPRIGHGFLSSDIAAIHNGHSNYNGETVSVTSDSTRKLREDSPSIVTRSMSPIPNTAETFPLAPTGASTSTSRVSCPVSPETDLLQQRLSAARGTSPVLSSEEKVASVKRSHMQSLRLRK